MGKLVKNHLARLIVLTAASYQFAAGIHGMFWPKVFFDYWTRSLNALVHPVPILQTLNVISGLLMLAWDYPIPFLIPGSSLHRSIMARLVFLPMAIVLSLFLYQATNPAIYYTIAWIIYFWAYSEGEVVCMPWKVPTRGGKGSRVWFCPLFITEPKPFSVACNRFLVASRFWYPGAAVPRNRIWVLKKLFFKGSFSLYSHSVNRQYCDNFEDLIVDKCGVYNYFPSLRC